MWEQSFQGWEAKVTGIGVVLGFWAGDEPLEDCLVGRLRLRYMRKIASPSALVQELTELVSTLGGGGSSPSRVFIASKLRDLANRLVLASSVHNDRVAKAQHLKAIDFTIGLVRRVTREGHALPGNSNAEVLKRLVEMRKASQNGFRLNTLLDNKALLTGAGSRVLHLLETEESKVMPHERDLAAFTRPFPTVVDTALDVQAALFLRVISAETGEDPALIEDRLIKDAEFFAKAFDAIEPLLRKAKASLDASIGAASEGKYESRLKKADSAFGKQGRNQTSILRFKDLVGCRSVVDTVANMARVSAEAQSKIDVLDKKNYFLRNTGYNAINYNLQVGGVVVEFQLKTSANAAEAALSHDLIYAPEKAIVSLSDMEKNLVARVIDVSTQLSMRDWAQAFDLAMSDA